MVMRITCSEFENLIMRFQALAISDRGLGRSNTAAAAGDERATDSTSANGIICGAAAVGGDG